jgi:hypothetical protein
VKKWALAIGWIASLIVVAALSATYALNRQRSASRAHLEATQAVLAFNHMDTYRELESDLVRGCYAEALEKAKISKDQQLTLLASFLKDHPDTSITKYVSDRDSSLIEQLKTFKSAYGSSWRWPKCSK